MSGTPFHADISVPPGTPAGTVDVFDPGAGAIRVTHCRVSTDTAQRVVVAFGADADGARLVAGYLSAGGSGIMADLALETAATGNLGRKIVLITAAPSGVEIQLEGCYLPATP